MGGRAIGFVALLWLLPATASARAEIWPGFAGVWVWGTLWNSHDTPFLRITRSGSHWNVETKHYMHADFVDKVQDVRIEGKHLEFSYWYEPRQKWAHCSLNATADTMLAGQCDGELDVHDWGTLPSYLWLQAPAKQASP
jgi:hypothetical protein